MALFGTQRDVSLFRHMSRELMADIITEQCGYYKYKLEETKINLYGEAAEEKFYMGPVLLNVLVERTDNIYPETDLGTDYDKEVQFSFLRDDLLDKIKTLINLIIKVIVILDYQVQDMEQIWFLKLVILLCIMKDTTKCMKQLQISILQVKTQITQIMLTQLIKQMVLVI